MKPGDVKRPVVNVHNILGNDEHKDKSRDVIHEEPATKTLDDVTEGVPTVKNITWKGRINEKDSGIGSDTHVLNTLKELREMVLAEQSRNKPGGVNRFHMTQNSSHSEDDSKKNNNSISEGTKKIHDNKKSDNDETLDQANSIIEKVEKAHTDGVPHGVEKAYQEEHPEDVKYVAKAKEILEGLPSDEKNAIYTKNNDTFSNGTLESAATNAKDVLKKVTTKPNNDSPEIIDEISRNLNELRASLNQTSHHNGITNDHIHHQNETSFPSEHANETERFVNSATIGDVSKNVLTNENTGISKFIAETFGFGLASNENGDQAEQKSTKEIKEPENASSIENKNFQEIHSLRKKVDETEKNADESEKVAGNKQSDTATSNLNLNNETLKPETSAVNALSDKEKSEMSKKKQRR